MRSRNKAKLIRRRAVLDGTDAASHTMIQQRTWKVKNLASPLVRYFMFCLRSSYIHINVLKFAVTTGCRIGEVLGLKWEDCDFEKRKIRINKTIHYSKASSPVEGSKFFYTTAKTISSNRVIPMTDEVYEILQNQKIKQTEQKMWKRSIWKQHKEFQNLVFTCSDGSPVYYYNVNSAFG